MTRILAAKRKDAIRVRRVLGSRLAGSVGRALACLAFGFCLAGCGSPPSPGERVELRTGPVSCYAGGALPFVGTLTADPVYGTTFDGKPAVWPVGYTGVRVGSEVAVVDDSGKIVATTGGRYWSNQSYIAGWSGAVGLRGCGRWSLVSCSGAGGLGLAECGTAPLLMIGLVGGLIAFWFQAIRWRLLGVSIWPLTAALLGLRPLWIAVFAAIGGAVVLWPRLRRIRSPDRQFRSG